MRQLQSDKKSKWRNPTMGSRLLCSHSTVSPIKDRAVFVKWHPNKKKLWYVRFLLAIKKWDRVLWNKIQMFTQMFSWTCNRKKIRSCVLDRRLVKRGLFLRWVQCETLKQVVVAYGLAFNINNREYNVCIMARSVYHYSCLQCCILV